MSLLRKTLWLYFVTWLLAGAARPPLFSVFLSRSRFIHCPWPRTVFKAPVGIGLHTTRVHGPCSRPVKRAVKSGVTKVGVTRCGNWLCRRFYLKKWWSCFSFLIIVTIPTLSVLPSDRLSSNIFLGNSAAKIFRLSLGCHPLNGVTRDGPLPSPVAPLEDQP